MNTLLKVFISIHIVFINGPKNPQNSGFDALNCCQDALICRQDAPNFCYDAPNFCQDAPNFR